MAHTYANLPEDIFILEIHTVYLEDGKRPEERTIFQGPYVRIGPAKAQRTVHTFHRKFPAEFKYGKHYAARERISKARILTLDGEWTELV